METIIIRIIIPQEEKWLMLMITGREKWNNQLYRIYFMFLEKLRNLELRRKSLNWEEENIYNATIRN